MQKKAPMGPHKLLKVCNGFFFGGLGLMAVIYLIGESYQWRGNDVSVFLWIAAGVGISLPHFCPDCGKTLDDCD